MRRELVAGAVLLSFFGLAASVSSAAPKLPQASPGASVSTEVGTTEVRIDYHRPGVKGRPIWGGLVPYGEVWRMGANEATRLTVSDPFSLAGHPLPAGSYSLFAIPGEKSWKILVNSQADQWGAYFRKPELDVLSFDVLPAAAPMTEWLTVNLTPAASGVLRVEMSWEKLAVGFDIAVDVLGNTWKAFDKALAEGDAGTLHGDDAFETYAGAARYSLLTGDRKADAFVWIEKAMKAKESFWNYELKGDLLARDGRYAEAIPLLDRAFELSKAGGAPDAYRDGLTKKKAEWESKAKP
ncbi:MAG: DUF2911 domain-containing protein [Thermoanaerobaculia bacterium]